MKRPLPTVFDLNRAQTPKNARVGNNSLPTVFDLNRARSSQNTRTSNNSLPTVHDLERAQNLNIPSPLYKTPEIKHAVEVGNWKTVADTFNLRVPTPPPTDCLITIAGEFISQLQDDYITSIE